MSHYLKLKSVIETTRTDTVNGLSSIEAKERLSRDGANVLIGKKKKTLIRRFFEQFKDTMVIILLFAAFLSLVIAIYNHTSGANTSDLVEDYLEPVIIMIIVILNAVLGTVQEAKAEKSLEALQKLSAPHVRVLRDGQVSTVEAAQLVVGDIILLEAGDIVSADARLIESASLKIDESALTGESVPVEKDYLSICSENSPVGDRTNMIFSGCPVSYGRAKAVVTATGMNTEIGKIAGLLSGEDQMKTPLQHKLTVLSKYLGIICLVVSVIVFGVGIAEGLITKRPSDPVLPIFMKYFMTAVSLAVAAIPEGLPAIVTIVLARGVARMVTKNAIARKLPAVETLGSASVICSDKTGTLTQNRMTVVKCYSGGKIETMPDVSENTKLMLKYATLCCDGTVVVNENGVDKHIGDPTETCIIVAARSLGMHKNELHAKHPRKYEIPFDSERKLMTTINEIGGKYYVIIKGAWESLIDKISGTNVDEIQSAVMSMSKDALRVLVVAYKVLDKLPEKFINEELEKDLIFSGLIGMIDPPREEAKEAVAVCVKAGIKPVMITGDHIVTASAIARQLGIMGEKDKAITGEELLKMSDEELAEKIENYAVYARVSPQDKLRIVKAWQSRGAVVAMTGDGVNDAPALKAADIGCAMGITGTDVAKGAADMVLTDDNFATIVDAVEEGRGIFDNIKKAVKYLLGCNLGEVLIVFIAMLIWRETPLLAIQLLWINLVTDGLPALAIGMERPEEGVMNRKPKPKSEGFFANGMGIEIIIYGVFFAVVTLVAYYLGIKMDNIPSNMAYTAGSTMAFLVLASGQLFFALEMRSNRSVFVDSPIRNKYMVGAFFVSMGLIVLVALVPSIAKVFGLTQLSGEYYGYALILSLMPLVALEIGYLVRYFIKNARKGKK